MKQFKAFVRKEFYHILRDRRTLIILLGMPVVQILIFGFALSNEVGNARFVVLDPAQDPATTQIITQLDASRYFDYAGSCRTYREIEERFRREGIKLAVVFPPSFNQELQHLHTAQIQLVTDASDPNTATTLSNYASAVINDYQARTNAVAPLPYTILPVTRMLYNPQLKAAYNFVPGVMAMVLMLVCTMMTAITIVKEKETGTMEVMLVSPVQPLKIVLAKAVPYLLLSLVNVVTILLLSVYALEVPVRGSIPLLLLESGLFIVASLSIGLLISTATGSQQTAMFLSLLGMFLPTVLLSGFMFPIENMPWLLQQVSHIVPAKWFYQVVQSIMIKGKGLDGIWKETGILLGMTVVFLLLSIKNFKIRLA
ncbi:MAG: ABC transporter permease [Williamsia sp.]|nr:ABC transporter permease [Williamsia sp.]